MNSISREREPETATAVFCCQDCETLLGGYLVRALSGDQMGSVDRHLAGCAPCRLLFDALSDGYGQLVEQVDERAA